MNETTEKTKIDWTAIDWNKTNFQIGIEMGVYPQMVSAARSMFGHKRQPIWIRERGIDPSKIDWTKSNSELSKDWKAPQGFFMLLRHSLGKPNAERKNEGARITKAMIDSVDWENSQNMQISKVWKVSREYVRQLRNEHGKPACKWHHRNCKTAEAEKWVLEHKEELHGKTLSDAMLALPFKVGPNGIGYESARGIFKRVGVRIDYRKKWKVGRGLMHKFNYVLSNLILSLIWGRPVTSIANCRKMMLFGRSKFDSRWSNVDKEQDEIIKLEIERAKAEGIAVVENAVWDYLKQKREAMPKTFKRGRSLINLDVNLELPSKLLGAIYNRGPLWAANIRYVSTVPIPKPRWTWAGSSVSWKTDPAFDAAVDAEIAKAREHGIVVDETNVRAVIEAHRNAPSPHTMRAPRSVDVTCENVTTLPVTTDTNENVAA